MKLKFKLNLSLSEFWTKCKERGSALLSFAPDYLAVLLVIIMLFIGVLKAPELHNKFLQSKVGSKVYYIRDQTGGGGGTGFAIKAPSGESYIMTNSHVCGVSHDGQTVLVEDSDDNSMRRRIIANDPNSDLCLIESLPGITGLSVASHTPTIGDTLYVVGHPYLQPTHIAVGEMTGTQDITVALGFISIVDPQTGEEKLIPHDDGGILEANCHENKHRIISQEMIVIFFTVKVKMCVESIEDAYTTAVVIYPGNSGSPTVNAWGQVEGVAFAGDGSTNWGSIVSLHDVKAFLKNF